MLVTKVKICGITNYEDAVASVDCGADIIGFNFYPKSPRYIPVEKAIEIARSLPGFVELAGVFVNSTLDQIRQIAHDCYLDWVQLHGDEGPEFCRSVAADSVKVIKAIRIKDKADLSSMDQYLADAILLDSYSPESYGGTGKAFDWSILDRIERRIFLAGGINPDNAPVAVALGVYGIDVCSGVEAYPGKKDPAKLKALFEAISQVRG
ncbi:MAG: phosphoribosylanthranilate isomerase [Sedimentisphaerales bacterium]|jgi:phosphoribosylanthranilate isomerase|nr:phosphoribosylanthranilate isomerase [Sedimentisphaerales bacterium]